MKHTLIHKPVALAALALCAAATVHAGEPIAFENGWNLDWRLNTTYQLGQRLEAQHPMLTNPAGSAQGGNSGKNDGNNNFKKNALVNNRVSALFESKLSKGETGLVLSASTFYDDAYHGRNDNNPGQSMFGGFIQTNPNAVNKPAPYNEFTKEAKRYHGGYSRILDAYGYTSFNFGEQSRANVRFGRHVVNWGESLFFPSIALAQGPFDGTKDAPGTETKDKVLPEDQLSVAVELNPTTSLLGHVQFGFHDTLSPAPGSFLSTADSVGPGGSCFVQYADVGATEPCAFGIRKGDIRPSDSGQWGLGVRHRISDETEVGLYYLNYKDRTPLPEIHVVDPAAGQTLQGGSYRIKYFDDVKLIGATASTTFGKVSAFAEWTYKEGAPVLVTMPFSPMAPNGPKLPNPTRANITQLSVGGMANLGRTDIAPSTLLLAELSTVRIGKITPYTYQWAPGFSTNHSNPWFDTKSSLAFSSVLVLEYPGIFDGWDLTVPIAYAQQIDGRALTGGVGGEDDKRVSLGASFTYNRNLSLGMAYVAYLGKPSLAPKTERQLADRDNIAFTAKYSF